MLISTSGARVEVLSFPIVSDRDLTVGFQDLGRIDNNQVAYSDDQMLRNRMNTNWILQDEFDVGTIRTTELVHILFHFILIWSKETVHAASVMRTR